MKKPISENAVKFNNSYETLKSEADIVKSELKKFLPLAKKLSKKAVKLSQWADKNCYEGETCVKPIAGIKSCDQKMDDLEWLSTAYIDLKDLIASFDFK